MMFHFCFSGLVSWMLHPLSPRNHPFSNLERVPAPFPGWISLSLCLNWCISMEYKKMIISIATMLLCHYEWWCWGCHAFKKNIFLLAHALHEHLMVQAPRPQQAPKSLISEGLGGLRVCCHWVGLWYIGRINWRSKHIMVRFVQMIMARPMTLKHTLSSHTSPKSRVKPQKIWGALNLGKKTFIEGYLNRWNLCPLVTRKPWVP